MRLGKALSLALSVGLMLSWVSASAGMDKPRRLSATKVDRVVHALLAEPSAYLSEDPSCRSDLSRPGHMSIADGLALMLTRAATGSGSLVLRVDCFDRPGFPLGDAEEVCRLAFLQGKVKGQLGYGLAFVMNWKSQKIRPNSVECYGLD